MEQENISANLVEKFRQVFESSPLLVRSPGRVNIIGEHTDYNEGFVLPAAIDKAIFVAINKRDDNRLKLYSSEFNEFFEIELDDLKKSSVHWANYILGVVAQFLKKGLPLQGFNLAMDGNVPIGAGLSSSAALECAVAYALNNLFGFGVEKMELVKMSQKAEHEYAGVLCGIMDQFASVFGKKDHAMKLDCRSLEYEYVPLKLEGYKLVLLNTNVSHSLASSEYNTRRQQCEQGVSLVKQHHPEVHSLRDVTINMLQKFVLPKDETVYRRCKYVVEENERLLSGCEDLRSGALHALGKKMFRTHEGLSKEYEVSCKELDFLVNAVRSNDNVLGARMMGGGFGGCTINIIKDQAIDNIVADLRQKYQDAQQKDLTVYIAQIEDGSGLA